MHSCPLTFPGICSLSALDLTIKLMGSLQYNYLPNACRSAFSQDNFIFIVMRILTTHSLEVILKPLVDSTAFDPRRF